MPSLTDPRVELARYLMMTPRQREALGRLFNATVAEAFAAAELDENTSRYG